MLTHGGTPTCVSICDRVVLLRSGVAVGHPLLCKKVAIFFLQDGWSCL